MSWRLFPRRRPTTADLEATGAAIIARSLRASADEYASTLEVGDSIIEHTDGPQLAPIRHLLPSALARRGLSLDQIPGGWRIIRSPWPPASVVPAECTICHGSWFSCHHGIGLTVAINWADPSEAKE
jgi:hypothetical protein